MADNPRTVHEIVPEDKNKQLSLPAEMIHRGLELASRIEQGLEIQPVSQILARKEYTVRCYPSVMEWIQVDGRPRTLHEADKNINNAPIYLFFSVDKDGLHLSCAPSRDHSTFVGIENNEDRYRLLTALNNLEPITIPIRSFGLYYLLSRPAGTNLRYDLTPGGGKPGFQGPLSSATNIFLKNNADELEIVIIYISLLGNPTLKQGLVPKKPPLKLKLVVIAPSGKDDSVATRELYLTILEVKNSSSAAA
jgi:hypothetical protein